MGEGPCYWCGEWVKPAEGVIVRRRLSRSGARPQPAKGGEARGDEWWESEEVLEERLFHRECYEEYLSPPAPHGRGIPWWAWLLLSLVALALLLIAFLLYAASRVEVRRGQAFPVAAPVAQAMAPLSGPMVLAQPAFCSAFGMASVATGGARLGI